MKPDFPKIVSRFQFAGEFREALPYGDGHINDTYEVWFTNGKLHRYILQRINHNIFFDPVSLMQNIEKVTNHIHGKAIAMGKDPERATLTLIPLVEGGYLYRSPEGEYWRAYVFIEAAQTFNNPVNPHQLNSAGKTFGRFQSLLADFPPDNLHETIPDFHHTRKRYDALLKAVQSDNYGRVAYVQYEIQFVLAHEEETSVLIDLLTEGKLPLRITHNDTKLNNVMFDDRTGEGICMIDLDTVMPGLSLYDFGDAVRTGTALALEDETDLSKVDFSIFTFEQLVRGYLDEGRKFLTPLEIENLVFSAKLMTFECGVRFLTDYLNGDIYFKTHREHQNLDRCRTQFKLTTIMENRNDEMRKIVDRYRKW